MSTLQPNSESVKPSNIDSLDEIVQFQIQFARTITKDYAEMVLHADFEAGRYSCGDVEIWEPERWPLWTDDWRWEPTPIEPNETERELVAHEEEERAAIADVDLLESTKATFRELEVEEQELLWPGTRESYEEWLDSLEPSEGELEARDLAGSWDFGHCSELEL